MSVLLTYAPTGGNVGKPHEYFLITIPNMVDPLFHLAAYAPAAAGIVVDKNGKEQQVVLFGDQIPTERGHAGKASGLGEDKTGVFLIIGGKGPCSAGRQN